MPTFAWKSCPPSRGIPAHDGLEYALYIELETTPGVETREVADGINVDLAQDGAIVGFDIDRGSERLDLTTLEAAALSLKRSV